MRRDNCLLVRNVVTTSLEKILIEKDVEGAQAYVRATIADLLMNRMDLSLLVITKVGVQALHRAPAHAACIWLSLACSKSWRAQLQGSHARRPRGQKAT